ncbi:MAG: HD domain-containing protein [Chloroflexi bacterium]|nr:HD domain-containing protein [Chloroflexota bacterium]
MPEITVEFARSLYRGHDAAHAFDHVLRVTRLAEHIAKTEGANVRIVRTAGLLHDMARMKPDHHLVGAARAREILADEDPTFIEAVAHCIEAHRFSVAPHPATLEAQCLMDADRLDAIGAIGVARAFAYAGGHNNRLWSRTLAEIREEVGSEPDAYRRAYAGAPDYTPAHELICKLERLAEGLHTPTARALAAGRHAFMVEFFTRLDREALGLE